MFTWNARLLKLYKIAEVIRGKGVRRQAFQARSGHLAQIVGIERARVQRFCDG
jgi:hypothetical protein